MKLIIEAKYIPDGSVVTKKTGTQQFTIRDNIKLYAYDTKGSGGLTEVLSKENTKYMVSSRGDISVVPGDTELCMDFSIPEEDGGIDLDTFQDMIVDLLQTRLPRHDVYVNIQAEIPQ